MRALIPALLAIALVTPTVAAADPAVEYADGPTWYLALGDSLAAGYQPIGDPGDDHRTGASYPDQLWLMARGQYPDLQLVNLACPGSNTELIREDYPRCSYPHGSQLDEALAFIDAHRDELAFITIDIGFNVFACDDSPLCVFAGIDNIKRRLPSILDELQARHRRGLTAMPTSLDTGLWRRRSRVSWASIRSASSYRKDPARSRRRAS